MIPDINSEELQTSSPRTALHMAVATSPTSTPSVTLESDVRLVKPALLYADTVTLYSPAAVMLASISQSAVLDRNQRVLFLRQIYPLLEPARAQQLEQLFYAFSILSKKPRGKSRQEIILYERLKRQLDALDNEVDKIWEEELVPIVEHMLESSSANQLYSAISKEILKIDPLVKDGAILGTDQYVDAFVSKLSEILKNRGEYPLFDEPTGTLVRHGVEEGFFNTTDISRRRGKQVAAASSFLERLPAFSAASVDEVVGIRDELRVPLIRFRSAMVELGNAIESAAYEDGFSEEVDEIYRSRVEPAILDLEEAVHSNSYLRVLVGEVVSDAKAILAATITFGVAQSADLPTLLAGGAAVVPAIAAAGVKHRQASTGIKKNEMYFLYQTNLLLKQT